MWNEIYTQIKTWMAEKKPEQWMISTIQNRREMKNTYLDTRSWTDFLKYIEMKASEENAIASGMIGNEGGMFVSIAGCGYDG